MDEYSRHPTKLYKNGIQRDSFIPAIELLQSKFDVTDLNSGTGSPLTLSLASNLTYDADYRRQPRTLTKVYYHPLNDSTRSEMSKLFSSFTDGSEIIHDYKLPIWGNRTLTIPECAFQVGSSGEGVGVSDHSGNSPGRDGGGDGETNIARINFKKLCGGPLSAADYIELTRKFDVIVVEDVPKMGIGEKDLVSRSSLGMWSLADEGDCLRRGGLSLSSIVSPLALPLTQDD
jgi:protein AFG1